MHDFFQQAVSGFFQQSIIELTAVALAVAYLVLAMRQNVWCWACAFVSTALFTWVFFDVSLVMESLLNVYYMAMAVYGYRSWTQGKDNGRQLSIRFWTPAYHVYALSLVAVLTLMSGYFLSQKTEAAWPYLDSFTTWGAVVTTYMVARKIFENWIYWFVINSVALFLYIERGLYPTALLMMIYLVLVIIGIISWSRQLEPVLSEEAPI
jgi:nicotinamide mononucleotide transporter PnuC